MNKKAHQGLLGLLAGLVYQSFLVFLGHLGSRVRLVFRLCPVAQADRGPTPSLLASERETCSRPFSLGRENMQ